MNAALKLPRSDFWVIIGSLTVVTMLCWKYLLTMARGMCCLKIPVWDAAYFGMMFSMWAVMMVGMMLPSVVPTVLIYAGIVRKAARDGMPVASTGAFTAGYLFMWLAFSLLATLAQWLLDSFALLSPRMVANSPAFGAIIL